MSRFQRFLFILESYPGRWPGLLHLAPLALRTRVRVDESSMLLPLKRLPKQMLVITSLTEVRC
jgi:hypothetical protein